MIGPPQLTGGPTLLFNELQNLIRNLIKNK